MTLAPPIEPLAAPEDAADDSSDLIDDGFEDVI